MKKPSLRSLRSSLTKQQQTLLNDFWKHYLDCGQWPTTFAIHRKRTKAYVIESLRQLSGWIVRESGDSQSSSYELTLVGILVTDKGDHYQQLLLRLLDFMRRKYLQEETAGEKLEFSAEVIGSALKLSDEERLLLGKLTCFDRVFRSYGHTVGGNWTLKLPKEIEDIPRKGSLETYYEELLLRSYKANEPVFYEDRQRQFFSPESSSNEDKPLSGHAESEKSAAVAETNAIVKKPKSIAIFVSHSSQDKELLQALTDLLRAAFLLPHKQIVCTSVPGHKLPGGADTEEELLQLLGQARLLIGVLTPASLGSSYVLFELGARWGLKKQLISLVACGTRMGDIKEPLKSKNALNAADQDDVHQLIENVATCLDQPAEPASAYNAKVRQLVAAAKVRKANVFSRNETASSEPENLKLLWPKLVERMSLKTEGTKDGCALFYKLASRHGLEPLDERPGDVRWQRVACAGAALSESVPLNFDDLGSKADGQKDMVNRDYEFELVPDLLERIAPVVEAWCKRILKYEPLRLTIRFQNGVGMESRSQQIKTNILETELSMTGKDTFELGKHWFTLQRREHSWNPVFEMTIWKKFSAIPWPDIFTALVNRRVLRVEKPLSKQIWM